MQSLDGDQRRIDGQTISGSHLVYGFLTTAPNTIVKPIHSKAMPVILTTDQERDVWLRALGRGEGLAAAVAG